MNSGVPIPFSVGGISAIPPPYPSRRRDIGKKPVKGTRGHDENRHSSHAGNMLV